jgi:anaerobic magnesium-protoporphyrin IX monomethyl ester cyclase
MSLWLFIKYFQACLFILIMKKKPVVFLSVTEYDNLGIGYLASLLEQAGFKTVIMDFRDQKDLPATLKKLDPLVIGFSIIFLNYISQFRDLVKELRENGIICHFTAGGHYASLRYEELFRTIPQLDSIVMFEGEYPMLELARCLREGRTWKQTKSLAYKENGRVILNPLQLPEKDLDKFPFPLRAPMKDYAFGQKFTVIIAGRGCVHNCSFCNTRVFYRRSKGPLKRIRDPRMVVNEMKSLYEEKQCSVFIFHDDDFPVRSIEQPDWLKIFCHELGNAELSDKILWKINCRSDDIEEESFALMKKNGLYLVFLGLEDGTDNGLKRLNKQLSVNENIKAITSLKNLNIGFDYGFMLFQPSTTFKSLTINLDFLELICGDGYTPVSFLRLIPLYETRVEKELIRDGRLIRSDGTEDYEFQETQMNVYYSFTSECFLDWQRSPEGLENISKWARNYCLVYMHYFNYNMIGELFCRKITDLIRESNLFLLSTMKELAAIFEAGSCNDLLLDKYKKEINSKHALYKNEMIITMAKLVSLVEAMTSK